MTTKKPQPTVFFRFRSTIPIEQQNHILEQIHEWADVERVERFAPDKRNEEMFRIGLAYLAYKANVAAIIQRLLTMPEIENAEVPAKRGLAKK